MKIFVCIKQVPAVSTLAIDEETGVLLRGGTAAKMNPYDLYALEAALRLREEHGGSVTVGSMGPPQAEAVICEAFRMGADAGFLCSDRRLAGADVLATSYTLAQAIQRAGDFDLILCGKQTTDGDTAQVGPSIAEHMNLPHAAWVVKLTAQEHGIWVEQQLQETMETVFLPFPCLITVEQNLYTPRLPSIAREREVCAKPIPIWGPDDFPDKNEAHYGLDGSATRVERIFSPESNAEHELWEDDAADRLYDWLKKQKFLMEG
ncbi:MAG: electron transfer flavoprotein subunit beta/FixA family protein [Clostridia bacterium]|nr:electron transfer flavoprotein subunit beta/FixA family protein [Clostridia bacterium]